MMTKEQIIQKTKLFLFDQDGTLYLIVHTGSRNLGKQVAEYYQSLAVMLHKGYEEYFTRRDAIIAEYKASGRRSEIQDTLKQLEAQYKDTPSAIPEDLCWLYGKHFEDYLHDVAICQRFAARNRELIAEILMERTGLVHSPMACCSPLEQALPVT